MLMSLLMLKVPRSTHFQVFIHQPGLQRSNVAHLTTQCEVPEAGGLIILQMMSPPASGNKWGERRFEQSKMLFRKKKKSRECVFFFFLLRT